MKHVAGSLAVALLFLIPPAFGQEPDHSLDAFHFDLEIDPTAYILSGSSLHAGLGWNRLRLDIALYSIDVPAFATRNDAFDVSQQGYGAKLQYFIFNDQSGGFIGIDGGVNRQLVQRKGTALASRETEYDAGVNFGWRFDLPARLYATPWLGVSYTFNRNDVTLGGSTYSSSPITVFPAVHLGYRFR